MLSCIKKLTFNQTSIQRVRRTRHKLQFITVRQNTAEFTRIKSYFEKQIAPLYGPQETALCKIKKGFDRSCELLQENISHQDLAILVYKTKLTNEFIDLEIYNTFEIKTLFLLDDQKNSGKKRASILLHRVAEKAIEKKASNILVSVSSDKPESLAFFLSYGFKAKKTYKDLYVKGLDEYFLVHPNPEKLKIKLEKQIRLTKKKNYNVTIFDFLFSRHENKRQSLKKPFFASNKKRMLFLSQEPLYSINNKQIGHLIISVDFHGQRHFLGFLPHKLVDSIFWESKLSQILININSIHIACIKNKKLLNALLKRFPNIRICNSYSFKKWSFQDFTFNNTNLTHSEINNLIESFSTQKLVKQSGSHYKMAAND